MQKTGLVLEGGGMRGVFTGGVLDFFMEKGIAVDSCFAVSAGACQACCYVSGQMGRGLSTSIDYLDDKEYSGLYSLITTGDMFGVDMLYNKIPKELYPIDSEGFLRSKIKLYAVITNCLTGRAEYPRVRNMEEDVLYIRASASMPLVSRMVKIDGVPYLDGGIASSIPIERSVREGNDKHIVVMTQPRGFVKKPSATFRAGKYVYKNYPKLAEAMANRHIVYNREIAHVTQLEKEGSAFVIQPPGPLDVKRTEKDKGKLTRAYEEGYKEAERRYQELKAFLEE